MIKTYVVEHQQILEITSANCEVDFKYGWESEKGLMPLFPLEGVDITLGGPNTLASPGCECRFIEPDNCLLHIQDPNPSLLHRIRFRLARWVLPSRSQSHTVPS